MDQRALLEGYLQRQPARALGGLRAMAGFDYQLRQYLAEFTESVVRSDALPEDDSLPLLEALSDIALPGVAGTSTTAQGAPLQSWICLQIKRTLDRSRLLDAAREAKAIDDYLALKHPQLRDSFRFGVRAEYGEPIAWSTLHDNQEIGPFIRKLEAEDRLEAPRIECDPELRAVRALWIKLRDPYRFIDHALRASLSLGVDPQASRRLRSDLLRLYAELRSETRLDQQQWLTPASFNRTDKLSPRYDVGSRITLARYCDGQYMQRRRIVDLLYMEWQEFQRQHSIPRDKIGIFWIQGRSGSGKSVLLLQLLERIVSNGVRTLWLRSDPSQLEDHLRRHDDHRDGSLADALPEVIAIDDLHAPAARGNVELMRLAHWIDDQGERQWPILLTCGPDEFAVDFDRETAHCGFDIRAQITPLVDASEAEDLRVWYRDRFEEEAQKTDTAFTQAFTKNTGLFISMAVELREGNLDGFAHRFAERISRADLGEALRIPLALNRLYLNAPAEWIDRRSREKLYALQSSGDISFDTKETESDEHLRLTHPHLADAIYRNMRKDGSALAYANDLNDAFVRALTERRSLLAFTLLRQCVKIDEPLSQRIQQLDTAAMADWTKRCTDWLDRERDDPHWVEIWRVLYTHPESSRLPLPAARPQSWLFDLATSWAEDVDNQSNRNWVTLLRYILEPRKAAAVSKKLWQNCMDWLSEPAHAEREEWPLIWRTLLENRPKSKELLQLGRDWLRNPLLQSQHDWPNVLRALFRASPSDQDVLDIGRAWLECEDNEERAAWSQIWRTFIIEFPDDDGLLAMGSDWLRSPSRSDREDWPQLWRSYCAAHPKDAGIAALGIEWLQLPLKSASAGWTDIWRTRIAASPEDGNLYSAGWEWLNAPGYAIREDWPLIWNELWKITPESRELFSIGKDWLYAQEHHTHSRWHWMLRPLLSVQDDTLEMIEFGRSWLLREEYQLLHGWHYVLDHLLQAQPLDEDFPKIGKRWLTNDLHETRVEWNATIRVLFKACPGDPELVRICLEWLQREGHDARDIWPRVCSTALEQAENHQQLQGLVLDWLGKNANGRANGWSHIFKKIHDAYPGNEDIFMLGRNWFTRQENWAQPGWSFVGQSLIDAHPKDQELIRTAKEWVQREEYRDVASYAYILSSTIKAQPADIDLCRIGLNFLESGVGRREPEAWSLIWQALIQTSAEDTDLHAAGLDWLMNDAHMKLGAWSFHWRCMAKTGTATESLHQLGRRWLKHEEHMALSGWSFVWQPLIGANPKDGELLDIGRAWLGRDGQRERKAWSYVWRPLFSASPDDAKLIAYGRNWLTDQNQLTHSAWPLVWGDMVQALPSDSALSAVALEWLLCEANNSHDGWSYIWGELAEACHEDPDIPAVGLRWLRSMLHHKRNAWSFVWKQMLDRGWELEEIHALGRQWLGDKQHHELDGWSHVWSPLYFAHPDDSDLLGLGRTWLLNIGQNASKGWLNVWRPVIGSRSDHQELLMAVWDWLTQDERPRHNSWPVVWQTMIAHTPADKKLLDLGHAWLSEQDNDHNQAWYQTWKSWMSATCQEPAFDSHRTRLLSLGSCGQGPIRIEGSYRATVSAHEHYGTFVTIGARSALLPRARRPRDFQKLHPLGSALRVRVKKNDYDIWNQKSLLEVDYLPLARRF